MSRTAKALATALLLCVVAVASGCGSARPAPDATNVDVLASAIRQRIPGGFVGLSMEYSGVSAYAGSDPTAPNPIFEQLVRNLAPGQRPVLRVGGDTTDWAWWPVPGMTRPGGMRITLDPHWIAVGHALARDLNARLIVGVNLEADNARIAGTMAQALISGIGRAAVSALELGNEPELYASFGWYRTPAGRAIPGRAHTWSFPAFANDFASIARSLPRVPVAGPNIGSPRWLSLLGPFIAGQPRLGLVAIHRYPFKHCSASSAISPSQLLSDAATKGLADGVTGFVALAHARGEPLRITEMNGIACGGERGVSDTFASALWALDALFQMARVGVDGINIHTATGRISEMFSFRRLNGSWRGYVRPIYYGLLTFARAVPAGSTLLRVSGPGGSLSSYATRAPDGRIRVVLINKDLGRSRLIAVRAPGDAEGALQLLRAPSIGARTGVTLGGRSFGAPTRSGVLPAPARTIVHKAHGRYVIELPPATAALLTL
ncbi:MAG TPA: glycosyl hydrolase family 79 C-terminal domain-containing protein [Solirubrobacteraceae bacterium]|nr:glycosyl hydrolase family 79 C-terminal domain-containing protein [Solirubrobacteraceae bacterium]